MCLSLVMLSSVFVKVVMRPPLDAFDVLIHLNPKQVPLLSHAVDTPTVTFYRGVMAGSPSSSGGAMPVVDYNPVSLYLAELRVSLMFKGCGFNCTLLTQDVRKAA